MGLVQMMKASPAKTKAPERASFEGPRPPQADDGQADLEPAACTGRLFTPPHCHAGATEHVRDEGVFSMDIALHRLDADQMRRGAVRQRRRCPVRRDD